MQSMPCTLPACKYHPNSIDLHTTVAGLAVTSHPARAFADSTKTFNGWHY
jgi:hypothetical protein